MRTTRHLAIQSACAGGLAVLMSILLIGCSPKEQEPVVATIGHEPLRLAEYEQQYLKTLGSREAGAATSMADREKFLDLVIKYRLKLAGAYGEGLDKKPEIVNEIASYKGNLAASYLTEREVVTPGLRQLYQRRSEEIRASHILLSLSSQASPTDSATVYKKAYELIAAIRAGADFGKLALENSQDPSAKQNKGDLYYFTAGQLVPPFEDAVFSMKAGDISPTPVRTQFGLHIIKVLDRKPAPGEVRASHIMIRFPNQDPSPHDTVEAYNKIKALKDSLAAGVDFAALARRQSEDPGSSSRGGDLGYFSRRRWVQPFDETVFAMKNGQLSNIVRTPYGYHLIKVYDIRPRKSFEDSKAELQPIYQQLRFQDDYARLVQRVRKEVQFARNDSVLGRFLSSLDTTKTTRDSAWWSSVSPDVGRLPLYSVQGQTFSVDSVIAMATRRAELSGVSLKPASFSPALEKVAEQLIFSAKADLLARDIPEFAALLKEYKEGILLYQVEQENVWNKVVMGDSVLKPYFAANREKFVWPDRINFTEVKASSDSLARTVAAMIRGGKSVEDIAKADSIRMAAPTSHQLALSGSSVTISAATTKALRAMAQEMSRDSRLRISLTARPDTTRAKERNLQLARKYVDRLTSTLVTKLKVAPNAIVTSTVPLPPVTPPTPGGKPPSRTGTLEVSLTGRMALVLGKPETLLLPVATDERTKRADSLTIGSYSSPFVYQGSYSIVRLNAREQARQKTYEETGPELSSAYQEYQSKQLENAWLSRLRADYPVIENLPALKEAFAPSR